MAVSDSTEQPKRDHCSLHFLLRIIYVEDSQKNKLLETEYNVAAVLRLKQSDDLSIDVIL